MERKPSVDQSDTQRSSVRGTMRGGHDPAELARRSWEVRRARAKMILGLEPLDPMPPEGAERDHVGVSLAEVIRIARDAGALSDEVLYGHDVADLRELRALAAVKESRHKHGLTFGDVAELAQELGGDDLRELRAQLEREREELAAMRAELAA